MISTDVIIIGAGPIGLELAVALKRGGFDYLQFDAGQVGQTIARLFPPMTRWFSSSDRIAIAGVPLQTFDQNKCTREEYLAYLRAVVMQFDLRVHTYEPLAGIERRGDGFVLTTRPQGGEQRYACKRLVLATGGTAKEKKLGIPGEELPHVSHFLTEPHDYFRRRLLVVGGKNSAIETALRCHNAGARVSLCHRRAQLEPRSVKYWLLPEMNGLIESGKIPGYFNRVPVEITPTHVRLRGCGEDACAGQEMDVEADAVLLMTGYVADMSLCRLAGVELTGPCEAPTFNPETMESNVLNVFLAGTVTGGTQERYTVFVENGHIHTDRIMAALTGAAPPPTPAPQKRPES